MKNYKEYNLLDNKKLSLKINLWSAFLLIVFSISISVVLSLLGSEKIRASLLTTDNLGLPLVFTVISIVPILLIHEGIHGVFFKLFSREAKVKFGYTQGFFYATSPGAQYSRPQWLWILVAPFTLITLSLIILFAVGLLPPFFFIVLTSLHGAGCVGDFYFAFLSLRAPKRMIYEDTSSGFRILMQNSM
jgi:hypothetical protein